MRGTFFNLLSFPRREFDWSKFSCDLLPVEPIFLLLSREWELKDFCQEVEEPEEIKSRKISTLILSHLSSSASTLNLSHHFSSSNTTSVDHQSRIKSDMSAFRRLFVYLSLSILPRVSY